MNETYHRILDVAEELFGRHGIGAVSLRQINAAAGVSPGILHYHFGGRDQLVEALLERRLPAITAERRALLKEISSADSSPSLRQLIDVIIRPLANLIANEGEAGRRYVLLLSRLSMERHPIYDKLAQKYTSALRSKVENGLIACLPDVDPAIVELRISMAVSIAFNTLGDPNQLSRSWQKRLARKDLASAEVYEALMDFVCGGLMAPDNSGTAAAAQN